jgi:hypothetical protein
VQFIVCRVNFFLPSFLLVYCVFVIVHCEVCVEGRYSMSVQGHEKKRMDGNRGGVVRGYKYTYNGMPYLATGH